MRLARRSEFALASLTEFRPKHNQGICKITPRPPAIRRGLAPPARRPSFGGLLLPVATRAGPPAICPRHVTPTGHSFPRRKYWYLLPCCGKISAQNLRGLSQISAVRGANWDCPPLPAGFETNSQLPKRFASWPSSGPCRRCRRVGFRPCRSMGISRDRTIRRRQRPFAKTSTGTVWKNCTATRLRRVPGAKARRGEKARVLRPPAGAFTCSIETVAGNHVLDSSRVIFTVVGADSCRRFRRRSRLHKKNISRDESST